MTEDIAAEIARLKNLPDQIVEQQIFNQANGFYLAAIRCATPKHIAPGTVQIASSPMVTCLSFAIELYLKCLLKNQNSSIKSHDLSVLSNKLNVKDRDLIAQSYNALIGGDSNYDKDIVIFAEAFIDWRYLYECTGKAVTIVRLFNLSLVLYKYVSNKFASWPVDSTLATDLVSPLPNNITNLIYIGGGKFIMTRN